MFSAYADHLARLAVLKRWQSHRSAMFQPAMIRGDDAPWPSRVGAPQQGKFAASRGRKLRIRDAAGPGSLLAADDQVSDLATVVEAIEPHACDGAGDHAQPVFLVAGVDAAFMQIVRRVETHQAGVDLVADGG